MTKKFMDEEDKKALCLICGKPGDVLIRLTDRDRKKVIGVAHWMCAWRYHAGDVTLQREE